jgi:cell growth-regulating nucleolar protein
MNGVAGEAPMRSWGGSPAPEEGQDAVNGAAAGMVQEASTSSPMMVDVEKKKKKKKKGDKGGTGSRANSSAAKRATTADAETPASTATTDQGDAVKATAEAPAVVIPATPMASDAQHTRPEGDSKKKRKAEGEGDEDATMTTGDASSSSSSSTSKTAKKLRKALQSIATSSKQSPSSSVPLASLIEKISGELSKKKKSSDGGVIDATGITRDIKVKFVEGSNGQEGQWVLEV